MVHLQLGTFVSDAQHEFSKTHSGRPSVVFGYHERSFSQYHSPGCEKRRTHWRYKALHDKK